MLRLTPAQAASLTDWFQPERPGPLVGAHLIQTGHGAAWADRWPAPRALLLETGGNYALAGDPAVLRPADLPPLRGFIDAPAPFLPLLRAALPGLVDWPRIIFSLPAAADLDAARFAPPLDALIRPLVPADAARLAGLSPEADWVCKTWDSAAGLAESGRAWGAFVAGALVSVASTFFAGAQYEDIAVATEPAFQRLGLSTAAAAALCRDIRARGRTPSWSTSTDNAASQRVALKLGFVQQRTDWLYVHGVAVS